MTNLNPINKLMFRGIFAFLFLVGCARLNIESKEPIKLDVTMRLDIYQHVAKDVDSIEDMVSGGPAPAKTAWGLFGVRTAWAEDADFPTEVKDAIERRRARRARLVALEAQGTIGENARGLVELRVTMSGEPGEIVADENRDRSVINAYVAQKNGATLEETAQVSAKRIQADAPAGTPIETSSGSWTQK